MPAMPARPPRRQFLCRASAWALAGSPAAALASVAGPGTGRGPRALSLHHTHTGERLSLVYAEGDCYEPQALAALNHFLRDHYSGEVGEMEPALLDQLHRVRQVLGSTRPLEVISGYRSERTNTMLRETRGGGVARRSLHLEGRAIDIRLPGVALAQLRRAALALRAGGVGYYAAEQFVHLDTGAVRQW